MLNPNILIGLAAFIILVLLSFALNNSSTISETDKENELRITKSDIESLYVVRTQEILSEEIASRYFYQEGRIRTSLNFDKEVQEAIIYLSKQDMYNSVLSVTN